MQINITIIQWYVQYQPITTYKSKYYFIRSMLKSEKRCNLGRPHCLSPRLKKKILKPKRSYPYWHIFLLFSPIFFIIHYCALFFNITYHAPIAIIHRYIEVVAGKNAVEATNIPAEKIKNPNVILPTLAPISLVTPMQKYVSQPAHMTAKIHLMQYQTYILQWKRRRNNNNFP